MRLIALIISASLAAFSPPDPAPGWQWPVDTPHPVVRGFDLSNGPYGAGHRGIDTEAPGGILRAPHDGVIAFVGPVVDRVVITLDAGDGVAVSFEPVAPVVAQGDRVSRGDVIAMLAPEGHTRPGVVHVGVRRNGAYIDPLLLFGRGPRAVLLPCCA